MMLILGRKVYAWSGYSEVVGFFYPLLSHMAALVVMFAGGDWGLSSFLAKGGPSGSGTNLEWAALVFNWSIAILLLLFAYRGRNKAAWTPSDWPIIVVPGLLHLTDIIFAHYHGFAETYAVVWSSSAIHMAILLWGALSPVAKDAEPSKKIV